MAKHEKAIFAAGCFWEVEEYFRSIPGVVRTRAGYAGGKTPNPTYEMVCGGKTGHAEAVEVVFDPKKITYRKLLGHYAELLKNNPSSLLEPPASQYRAAIFFHGNAQKKEAVDFLKEIGARNIQLNPASDFWEAEEYHQQYLSKNKMRSCRI